MLVTVSRLHIYSTEAGFSEMYKKHFGREEVPLDCELLTPCK